MPIFNEQEVLQQARDIANQMNTAVDTSYSAGLGTLQQSMGNLAQEYNPYRNAAELQSRYSAKALNEQMANVGLSASGTNLSAQTKLQTSKQGAMNQINSAEQKAKQDIQSQIANLIAQRESAKQSNIANQLGNAQQTINSYKSSMGVAEQQQAYQKENMALQQSYAVQNAQLDAQLREAAAAKDFERTRQLNSEKAALDYSYNAKLAALDQTYTLANKAVDQSYTQQNMATQQKYTAYNDLQDRIQEVKMFNLSSKQQKELAAIEQGYTRENKALDAKIEEAKAKKDYARASELYKEQQAIAYGYDAKLANLNSSLSKSEATYKASLNGAGGAGSSGGTGGMVEPLTTAQKVAAKNAGEKYRASIMNQKMSAGNVAANLARTYGGVGSEGYKIAMGAAGLANWASDDIVTAGINEISNGGKLSEAAAVGLSMRANIQNHRPGATYSQVKSYLFNKYGNNQDALETSLLMAGFSQNTIDSWLTKKIRQLPPINNTPWILK